MTDFDPYGPEQCLLAGSQALYCVLDACIDNRNPLAEATMRAVESLFAGHLRVAIIRASEVFEEAPDIDDDEDRRLVWAVELALETRVSIEVALGKLEGESLEQAKAYVADMDGFLRPYSGALYIMPKARYMEILQRAIDTHGITVDTKAWWGRWCGVMRAWPEGSLEEVLGIPQHVTDAWEALGSNDEEEEYGHDGD